MQEVLQKLQKELENAYSVLNNIRSVAERYAIGSASWRECNERAHAATGKIEGLEIAIKAIERAGAAI